MTVTSMRYYDVLREVLQLHKRVVTVQSMRYDNDIKGSIQMRSLRNDSDVNEIFQ